MDYFIIVATTVAGLAFHAWLYLRIRRWIDRDLALALAGNDADMRSHMLECLVAARQQNVPRKALPAFLERAAFAYEKPSVTPRNTP
ncbi:conserved hypothetical protein [Pseudomonas sp. 8Z]|uniref:hypothetical protein n=1 Tax=Pseudomonas sp. 8Z TaxID=2653166 RepID=UPI0012F19A02|nr:hypothetical protein [Pseudomonas sp. 8Z]VXC73860.1 conserved hypothetical protein [Pseudomonas sp. 8Z]